ncbi:bifunctional oligoribonuclease/PAP phosphatase NrnA [Thalassobacillus sp. CUG 92003]|uniref:DHH family phosphoesterase n=1 Tax=Thalassobacillus sp. CUG 92003 TaxID=2736641 RepID=UPI0015E662C2|nr:bifunctional oligoribonuclease/PAP phosphatase NrnA [Thalassobacillus sp. CUG 92003]
MVVHDIVDTIKAYDTIIIHRHVRPDPDAYGSQGALAEMIMTSFPEKNVFVTGLEDESLNYLLCMDKVPDEAYEQALVIVCDTANQARIDDQRYKLGDKLIKIDHHPTVDEYGDIQWVDTTASSTSEMIFEVFLSSKDDGLTFNDNAARLAYAGIVGDTGRFLFPSTSRKTLEYAAELVMYSFDRSDLYDNMYKTKMNLARLKGYILQHFSVSSSGHIVVTITKDILEAYHVSPMETSQLVGLLGDIEDVLAWVFFIEEDELIRVRLRSKGPAVNEIASRHNGGGHPMAAGATAYSWEETETISQELDEACRIYKEQ